MTKGAQKYPDSKVKEVMRFFIPVEIFTKPFFSLTLVLVPVCLGVSNILKFRNMCLNFARKRCCLLYVYDYS
jgi:hypothetical protein